MIKHKGVILKPLVFSKKHKKPAPFDFQNESDDPVLCVLCSQKFKLFQNQECFFKHLFIEHRLVIADLHTIASLTRYVEFWRARLATGTLEEFCSTMLMDALPDSTASPEEKYFLLSDVLPEDRLLREGLQKKRLEWVLERQQFERENEDFSRDCLFCRQKLEGSRASALAHLSEKHGLLLGRSDNLVFVDELLDKLQDRLTNLHCLFCGNKFPDRPTLKEHMRKKSHKAINPEDIEYDRFYVVNYLELGKKWKDVEKEKDIPQDSEESWSDWCDEDEESNLLHCLFCDHQASTVDQLNVHSQFQHGGFSLANLKLDFYLKVKLVNYIRRQMHLLRCPVCDAGFQSHPLLVEHLSQEQHYALPDQQLFDQPQYYFSTYEDDVVLFSLQDDEEVEIKPGTVELVDNKTLESSNTKSYTAS